MLIPNHIITSKSETDYLSISFKVLSSIPDPVNYDWDFGDGNSDTGKSVSHTYSEDGVYMVELTVSYTEDSKLVEKYLYKVLVLTNKSKTQLDGSIYDLVYSYIPKSITDHVSESQVQFFINKWQLYIHPLVNHCIPDSEYNNELYYEALENVLIMQLAAYELTVVSVFNMLQSYTNIVSSETSESTGEETPQVMEQAIKKIVTGPTETEFFDLPDSLSDSEANLVKTITGAFQPGGMIDTLKENICMLSERVRVVITIICRDIYGEKVPYKSRTYRSGPFRGPNNANLIRRRR